MSRGQGMTLNTVIVTMMVTLVLIFVILIFTDHARSFNERLEENRCDDANCAFAGSSLVSGVSVSAPSEIEVGEAAVFHVRDEHERFERIGVDVEAPGDEPGTGQVTKTPGDNEAGTLKTTYERTQKPGTYTYTVLGIRRDGSREVIERGSFTVVERRDASPAVIEAPSYVRSGDPVYVRVHTARTFERGSLVFRRGDDAIEIPVSYSFGTSMAGEVEAPSERGVYVLDTRSSRLVTAAGHERSLSSDVDVRFEVTDEVTCEDASDCSDAAPFCTADTSRFACSSVCAAAGERAADGASCCEGLVHDERGLCSLPGKPLRIVLVPIGMSSERLGSLALEWESALRTTSPLRACAQSRLTFDVVEDGSCMDSCALPSREPIEREAWDACLDALTSCGRAERVDADRIGGIVAGDLVRVLESSDEGRYVSSFSARAELGGDAFVLTETAGGSPRAFLRQLGFTFGLMPLACSDSGEPAPFACTGPNRLDCSPGCIVAGSDACFSDPETSRNYIMSSCDGASVFGPEGDAVLSERDAFIRATEVCV